MARVLNTTVLHDGVVYDAGTAESDIDGADGITAEGVWDGESDDSGSYGSMKVADLRAEIDRRNEGREDGDKVPAEGNKADLVAALELDDESS